VKSAEARDEALVTLYEADQRRQDPDTAELSRRAAEMVAGVWGERGSLDEAIGDTATGWRVERMPPVDRNVLRMALWELRNRPGTPVPVVISEAVRLAKTYSTARSGGFVNGVLAKLAGERRPIEG
jgi:N utilization substance protein B